MTWLLGLLALGVTIALTIQLWYLSKMPEKHSRSVRAVLSHHFSGAGYSVWCYQHGHWTMLENRSAPGHLPGPPPTQPGVCDGYCLKVASVRAPKGH